MRAVLYTAAWVLPMTAPPIQGGAGLVDERGRSAAVAPTQARAIAVVCGEVLYRDGRFHSLGDERLRQHVAVPGASLRDAPRSTRDA